MSISSLSTYSPHDKTIDLTGPETTPEASSALGPRRPSLLVDLTDSADDMPILPQDHMHTVVDLIPPVGINFTGNEPRSDEKRRFKDATSPPSHCRKTFTSQVQAGRADVNPEENSMIRQQFHMHPEELNFSSSLSPPWQPESPAISQQRARRSLKLPFKPLPFMNFPPEIRNLVYRSLLTTPRSPIELPELTGRNGAAHRARWANCINSKMRRDHKTIFLEILETCKQIHDEASGILYGCNVFKYRSHPRANSKLVVLPTRHLQLLKHIKISVITRGRQIEQDRQVADLVKHFVKDGLMLETFEITWWGEDRYHLREDSAMCQALRSLVVEKHFSVKVIGEARMEKAMEDKLEHVLLLNGVNGWNIQRPIKDDGEELSAGEGRLS